MTEQATTVIEVEVEGRRSARATSRVFTGSPKSLLWTPWFGGVRGISLTQGPTGSRATVVGSGLDVWEIIATWHEVGENHEELRAAYHWLTEEQIHAALEYYERNEQEIESRLAREEQWTPEAVSEAFPFTRSQA